MIKFFNDFLNESINLKIGEIVEDFLHNIIINSPFKNKVYIAGGYVRDQILKKPSKDIDLVVEMPNGGIKFANYLKEYIKQNFNVNINVVIYENFGTAQLKLKNVKWKGVDLSDIELEMVMTRKEEYMKNSRKPITKYGTIYDDVFRRDLTVNSLLKDLTTGEILDLTGNGIKDIKNGIIRTTSDPDSIFNEDPLRMLRAIRFSAKYNWKIPKYILISIKENASRLSIISKERIKDELNKMLLTKNPDKAIKLLKITNLLNYTIPELQQLVNLKQNKYHKWDAFNHSLNVLKNTPPKLITRLSGLLHDIGKYKTKEIIDNEIHFYKHEKVGAELAREILKRLKYPNNIIEPVVLAIDNHMRTKVFGDDANMSDKVLRKLQKDLKDHIEDVLDLIHADNISHADDYNLPNQVPNIRNKLKNLKDINKIKLPLNGFDIMNLFNVKGAKVGMYLRALEDKFLENPNLTKDDAIDYLKSLNDNDLKKYAK